MNRSYRWSEATNWPISWHVRLLADQVMPAGEHLAVWDGRNDSGGTVEAGVCLFRIEAQEAAGVRKVTIPR